MLGFLIPFLVALVTAAVVMPLTIWISRRAGMLDAPEARKVHLNPTPRLGGIAIFAGIVTGSIAAFPCPSLRRDADRIGTPYQTCRDPNRDRIRLCCRGHR